MNPKVFDTKAIRLQAERSKHRDHSAPILVLLVFLTMPAWPVL